MPASIKNIGLMLVFFVIISSTSSCVIKNADTPKEEQLVFTINPDPGNAIIAALSRIYDFNINITSAMPPRGVYVTVKAIQELNNEIAYNYTGIASTSNYTTDVDVLKQGVVYYVVVEVVSIQTSSNYATKTFRIARK